MKKKKYTNVSGSSLPAPLPLGSGLGAEGVGAAGQKPVVLSESPSADAVKAIKAKVVECSSCGKWFSRLDEGWASPNGWVCDKCYEEKNVESLFGRLTDEDEED